MQEQNRPATNSLLAAQKIIGRICNFPISKTGRCKQPIADGRPNCGRHHCEVSAQQLGQSPIIYEKNNELHVWPGDPDGLYCLIHSDPAYQVLYRVSGETPPCCLDKSVYWRDEDGQPHRDDGPAMITPIGGLFWYQHGKRHREDGPAEIWTGGSMSWRQHGKLHRDDGPAVIESNGRWAWYQHGELHRDDGPAVTWPDGEQWWCQHDQLHRDDGPARIRLDGRQWWYQNGKLHRDDGPAEVHPDGTQKWYWHDKQVTKEEYAELREQSRGT